jgi:mannose-6-phosphate isomerase-like protein (cupin superfamily)
MSVNPQPPSSRRKCLATLAALVPMASGLPGAGAAVGTTEACPDSVGNQRRFRLAKDSAAVGFEASAMPLAKASPTPAAKPRLASNAYPFEDLKEEKSGGNSFWPILNGTTWAGCPIEVHETRLAPGGSPHAPHLHAHEEMFLVREGTVEVTIAGRATRLGPGSAAYVASNDQHGIKNAGTDEALYFVLAVGSEST